MSGFLKKLNVLIKANVNDFLGQNRDSPLSRFRPVTEQKDTGSQISTLRSRMNEAMEYGDGLEAKVQALQNKVLDFDAQANEAVSAGNEDAARRSIEQMELTKQRLTMAEAELKDHRELTRMLFTELSALEANYEEVQAQQKRVPVQLDTPSSGKTDEDEIKIHSPSQGVSDILRDTRSKIDQALDNAPASLGEIASRRTKGQPKKPKPEKKSDLDSRLARLSKPEDEK